MITGIGTDIVTIARLTGLHARHGQRAVARLLSARASVPSSRAHAILDVFSPSASLPRRPSARLWVPA
jgi:phosphopantetheinyl transferase (holo-ACP synthase)